MLHSVMASSALIQLYLLWRDYQQPEATTTAVGLRTPLLLAVNAGGAGETLSACTQTLPEQSDVLVLTCIMCRTARGAE